MPEPSASQDDDDWAPFTSHAGFQLADLLLNQAKLPQKKVDKLLELWAATLVPHEDVPPIADHHHLHRQIGGIELGIVKREGIILKYNAPPPPATTRPP